ncbi:MAG TPA: hypothetical protein VGH60_08950 [Solirubrobacteraceae bacterium]
MPLHAERRAADFDHEGARRSGRDRQGEQGRREEGEETAREDRSHAGRQR